MLTESVLHKTAVTEGYRVLLQAEVSLILPSDYPQICKFYRAVGEKCLAWAVEIVGERLRRAFLSLDTVRERSRFATRQYRLSVAPVWEKGNHAAFLCRSFLPDDAIPPDRREHRMVQVWCLPEETALPLSEVRTLFDCRHLPFRPDGIYPEGGELVVFRNARASSPPRELRLPFAAGENM